MELSRHTIIKRVVGAVLISIWILMPTSVSAAGGGIDPVYKYAWNAMIGWINFGTTTGNVQVSDTEINGFAWSPNAGWINLSTTQGDQVTNTVSGDVGGNAWGETIGYIDFSNVSIDSEGFFHGTAQTQNIGLIAFNCMDQNSCASADFRVKTFWTPSSTEPDPTPEPPAPPASRGSDSIPSIKGPDIDGDGIPETAHNNDNKTSNGHEHYNGSRSTAKNIDGDNDDKHDFLITIHKDIAPTYYWDPDDNIIYKISAKDVTGDGMDEWFFDADGDKIAESYYERITGKVYKQGATLAVQKVNPSDVSICTPYITSYIEPRANNDTSDVVRLKTFLKDHEKEIGLPDTDQYDTQTMEAVIRFQEKYKSDILDFWHLKKGSGRVYITTRSKINALYCAQLKPTLTCPYFEYSTYGTNNDVAAQKIQNFLNETQGENLTAHGIHDAATVAAVKRFQTSFASAILTPWGHTNPTGNVLQTTRKQMHRLIGCFEGPVRLPNGTVVE